MASSVKYFEQDFNTLDLPEDYFTLMVVNNVLEHTPALEDTLAQLSKVLAHDGVCYIYQGNNRAIDFVLSEPTIDCRC